MKEFAGTREAVSFGGAFPPADSTRRASLDELEDLLYAMNYNGRLRRAGESPAHPDTFPFRMAGMPSEMRADPTKAAAHNLWLVPDPMSPADGSTAAAGKVLLTTRNIGDTTVTYIFEIEGLKGAKETSPPVARGDQQTAWTPKMRLRSGETYTWSVSASLSGVRFPAATATFRANK